MYQRHLKNAKRLYFSPRKLRLRIAFWGGALLIGVTAAAFAMLSNFSDKHFYLLYEHYPWVAYALPPLGLALIAWLTCNFFNGSEGSGIPQAIAALEMREQGLVDKVLSLKVAGGKIVLTSLGLLCGASIGREGPTVHIATSIMYSLRHVALFRGRNMTRSLILAGGAAGIAAAFNTPIAGIMFAIEEMGRNFDHRTSGTLIVSVVLAGLLALVFLGDYTYFGKSTATLPLSTAWLAVLICGVGGGLLGGLFSSSLVQGMRLLTPLATRHPVRIAFVCGLFITLFGFSSNGHTFGTGYEAARQLVDGAHPSLAFPFLKMLATTASYLSGIPGGIFAPSLSVGAGLGANLALLMPHSPAPALIMLGMVGYFSGVVQTPITAFIIVMEMNADPSMLFPLMVTSLIAKGASYLVCPVPIYEALAEAYLAKTNG